MKIKATLTFEYELPAAELQAIKDSEENGDPTDDFIEEAEGDFYYNDATEFISQRLLNGLNDKREIEEHLEAVTFLRLEVTDH